MYCKKCGKENADDSRFCKHCGASLTSQIPVPEQRTMTAPQPAPAAQPAPAPQPALQPAPAAQPAPAPQPALQPAPAPQPTAAPQPAPQPGVGGKMEVPAWPPTKQAVMERMDIRKPETALTLAGWILCILCVFPAYISVTIFGSVMEFALIEGDGCFFLGLGIAGIVTMYLKKEKAVLGISIATVVLAIFEIFNFSDKLDELGGFGSLIRKGAGYYLMVLGCICLITGTVMKEVKKRQGGKANVL